MLLNLIIWNIPQIHFPSESSLPFSESYLHITTRWYWEMRQLQTMSTQKPLVILHYLPVTRAHSTRTLSSAALQTTSVLTALWGLRRQLKQQHAVRMLLPQSLHSESFSSRQIFKSPSHLCWKQTLPPPSAPATTLNPLPCDALQSSV